MPGNQLGHVIGHPAFEGSDGHAGEAACCVRFGVHGCDDNTRPVLSGTTIVAPDVIGTSRTGFEDRERAGPLFGNRNGQRGDLRNVGHGEVIQLIQEVERFMIPPVEQFSHCGFLVDVIPQPALLRGDNGFFGLGA